MWFLRFSVRFFAAWETESGALKGSCTDLVLFSEAYESKADGYHAGMA